MLRTAERLLQLEEAFAAYSKPVKIGPALSQGPSLHPQAPPQLCPSCLQPSVGGSHALKVKKHPLCARHPEEGFRHLGLKRAREGGVPTPTLVVREVCFLLRHHTQLLHSAGARGGAQGAGIDLLCVLDLASRGLNSRL